MDAEHAIKTLREQRDAWHRCADSLSDTINKMSSQLTSARAQWAHLAGENDALRAENELLKASLRAMTDDRDEWQSAWGQTADALSGKATI